MATVTVSLPSLLQPAAGGLRELRLEAATLREGLEKLGAEHPRLRALLFDEAGGFRQHVLCFHNDVNTRWLESLERPLRDDDRLTILQAVSGG